MRRRELLAVAGGAALLRPLAAAGQQPKMPVVGILVAGRPDPTPMLRLFRQGLHSLGYVEGQNIQLDIRNAEGKTERLPEFAADLVRAKVDVIAAWMVAVPVAKRATSEIPIVMLGYGDPVGDGTVASFARPGGNITGMAGLTAELGAKNVELLKEMLPGLTRIAALCNAAATPFAEKFSAAIERAGKAQGVEIVPFMVTAGPQLDAAFPDMTERQIGAAIVQPSLPLKHVADLALAHRLPAASPSPLPPFPALGGLMGYTLNPTAYFREAAVLVDKILKGAKPADLPVEQPTRFELVINLKTAKALGLTVPQSLLARADEVIE